MDWESDNYVNAFASLAMNQCLKRNTFVIWIDLRIQFMIINFISIMRSLITQAVSRSYQELEQDEALKNAHCKRPQHQKFPLQQHHLSFLT